MRNMIKIFLLIAYLMTMAYFAFRPFKPIYGLLYASADLTVEEGCVHVRRDASLEASRDVKRIRNALSSSGQMSLNVVLQTDSVQQISSHIFGLTRDGVNINFALDQDGNALEFRLCTTSGQRTSILTPQSLDEECRQDILVTYDGTLTRLYVDGLLRDESTELHGDFENWGYNQCLTLGDYLPGGSGWNGRVWRIAIYDRALSPGEAEKLVRNESVAAAVVTYDFGSVSGSSKELPADFRPMQYRNPFVTTGRTAYDLNDCIFNVAGFVPLGIFVYMLLPLRLEKRKILAAVVVPSLAGLFIGGTIEFLQQYIYGRVPCAPDLIYNMTGSLLGGLLGWLSFSTFQDRRTNGNEA